MPQMWPSQWSLLFFFFLGFFFLFMVVFYFNMTPQPESKNEVTTFANRSLIWQW